MKTLLQIIFCLLFAFATAQTASSTVASSSSQTAPSASTTAPPLTGSSSGSSASSTTSRTTRTSSSSVGEASGPPDVVLHVPNLSVGRIELDVENLKADINLNAQVASLVTINAGVALSIQKVNITIADVKAELDLVVRLGHLVDIVNRVFESLDLNPLLLTAINDITGLLGTVVGVVDGLLGSITQGGTTLSFLIDNLGNIVQQVAGANGSPVSTIVGDYLTNMTFTGESKALANGLVQKTYSYLPLNALVHIILNAAGQVVQAVVAKPTSGSSTSTGPASTTSAAAPSGTNNIPVTRIK